MNKALYSAVMFSLAFGPFAHAAETKGEGLSKLKIEDTTEQKNKVSGDIDQEIQNAKLRAESGSKSKYSLSIQGKYTGGTAQNAFGTERPNLSADPGNQLFTSFDMGLAARYRWNKNDSATLGTAFGFVTPFQGRVVHERDAINVNDPVIGYNHAAKIYGLQTVGIVSYAYGTSIPSLDINETHQFGLGYNAMKDLGHGINVGTSVGTGYNFFSTKAGEGTSKLTHSRAYGYDTRTQYALGIYPQAEYAISDRYSLRTVFGYFNWRHLYGDQNHYRMLQTFVYQSVGFGIAVTRDIYLYPNIQFIPDNIRSDYNNVALNATINVF